MVRSCRLLALCAFVAMRCSASPPTRCVTSSDCAAGMLCVGGSCVTPADAAGDHPSDVFRESGIDAGMDGGMDANVGPMCTNTSECDGGVCISGGCCASADVCGNACCGGGAVCFANTCVTPGRTCHTTADCDAGSYCETALGIGGDGGVADGGRADGRVCTESAPVGGRCLVLPPLCPDADGGVADAPTADGGTACIGHCEYHPSVGLLDSTLLWSWGQPTPPPQYPGYIDVWSTPAVGRVYDANCDGHVDQLDPPDLVFISGHSVDAATGIGTCCQCTGTTPTGCLTGVLRVLDGRTGQDLLAVRAASPSSVGFAGTSVAIGDVNNDGVMEIVAVTGEGYIVVIDGQGNTLMTSDVAIPAHTAGAFGWGGGLAIADMDNDGAPEIVYGPTVFTTARGFLRLRFTGTAGQGGPTGDEFLSTIADVDNAADGHLELVTGRTAYRADGSMLWDRTDLPDGFPGIGDFNLDGHPDVVLVSGGRVWILDGATGATELGPVMLPGTGFGGGPTVGTFAGTGHPQIGVAQRDRYTVLDPNYATHTIDVLWHSPNHDFSSSVTGSTVFDFEGDGIAEVLYADECFIWVFEGPTGRIKWAGITTSFTGTEASVVADVDGDGHAEIVSVSNGADPSPAGWGCDMAPWNAPDTATGRPAWHAPSGAPAYRGMRIFRDASRSWVGTRQIWNEHTYHVTNVCMENETLCPAPTHDGQIPRVEPQNWTYPWLNDFRQNVQVAGLFSAPDAAITLYVRCSVPFVLDATVRNLGEASLPSGVNVGFYTRAGSNDTLIGMGTTTSPLFPGAGQDVLFTLPSSVPSSSTFVAKIIIDPTMPAFHECRTDNNVSAPAMSSCPG